MINKIKNFVANLVKPRSAAITKKLGKNLPKVRTKLSASTNKLKSIAATTGQLALTTTSLIGKTALKAGKGAVGLAAGIAASMLGGRDSTTPSRSTDAERITDTSRDTVESSAISQEDSIGEKTGLSFDSSTTSIDSNLNFYNQVLKYLKNINNNVDDLRFFIPKMIEDFNLQLEESQYEKIDQQKKSNKLKKSTDEDEKSNLVDLLSGLGLLGLAAFPDALNQLSDAYKSLVQNVSDGFTEVADAVDVISSGLDDIVLDAKKVIEENSAETSLATMLSIAGFIGSFSTPWGLIAATSALVGYGGAKLYEAITERGAESTREFQQNREDADKLRKNNITSMLYSSGLLPAKVTPADIESWVNRLPPGERDNLSSLLTVYQTTPVAEIGQKILNITDQLVAAKMYGEEEGVSMDPLIDISSTPLTSLSDVLPGSYSTRSGGELQSSDLNIGNSISTASMDVNDASLEAETLIINESSNNIMNQRSNEDTSSIDQVPETNSPVIYGHIAWPHHSKYNLENKPLVNY